MVGFKVIAVVDNDTAGKRALHTITKGIGLREYEDVLVLKHRLPRGTRDPDELRKRVDTANAAWRNIDCEIEDFISVSVLQSFAAEHHGACIGHADFREDGVYHFNWSGHLKPSLARYVRDYATLADVERLVEFLKFLRFLLQLPPDGV